MKMQIMRDTIVLNTTTDKIYRLGWTIKDEIELLDINTSKKIGMQTLGVLLGANWVELIPK